jgi:hypothetical protein
MDGQPLEHNLWVDVVVVNSRNKWGLGKTGKFKLTDSNYSTETDWNGPYRTLGRMDIFSLFGDFDGLENISRKHVLIFRCPHFKGVDKGKIYFEDHYSKNGTNEVKERPLFSDGESVYVGPNDIVVSLGGVLTLMMSNSDHAPDLSKQNENFADIIPSKDCTCCEMNLTVHCDYNLSICHWCLRDCGGNRRGNFCVSDRMTERF